MAVSFIELTLAIQHSADAAYYNITSFITLHGLLSLLLGV